MSSSLPNSYEGRESLPRILFFDSGMGGLSVFKETYKLNSHAAYYYLFDHECFPYGNKSEVFLKLRVSELLQQASTAINPDLIVIACNTASTTVLSKIRGIFNIPIVGVVPAIKPAAKVSQNKFIALLATPGTVNRAYTDFLINEFAYDCKILKIGTEDLVRLAENSLLNACRANSTLRGSGDRFCDMQKLKTILKPILDLSEEQRPDTVVLGCTHFPLLREQIRMILGDNINLVDSGEAIARRVADLLSRSKVQSSTNLTNVCSDQKPPLTTLMGAKGSTDVSTNVSLRHDINELMELAGENSVAGANESGPRLAFYTGSAYGEEREKLESTFAHFGFASVQPFGPIAAAYSQLVH